MGDNNKKIFNKNKNSTRKRVSEQRISGGTITSGIGLHASEARFRNILEFLPIGIKLYDSAGKLIHVNKACINIFGINDAKELSNCTLFDDPNLPSDAPEKLLRGEEVEYEFSLDFEKERELALYTTSRSGIIYLHVIISALYSEGANPPQDYLVQIQDITGRKHMEKTLRESEKKYRDLVKYAPAGIYEMDFWSKRFTSVNDAMCRLSGYTREELLDMSPFDLMDDKSQVVFQERINQWLNGEKPDQKVEYKVKAEDVSGRLCDFKCDIYH